MSSTLLSIANSVPDLIGQNFTVASVNDVAMIEFDVEAEGDFIAFDFIFYSDEYPNFINTNYNDVFALLASGPGVSGPNGETAVNLAVGPNTDPVLPITVSSVNPTLNPEYFIEEFPPQFCANGGNSASPPCSTPKTAKCITSNLHWRRHRQCAEQLRPGQRTRIGGHGGLWRPICMQLLRIRHTYADSVCTYAEIELLDTLDIGAIHPVCPTVIASSTLNGVTLGLFSGLSGDIEWSHLPWRYSSCLYCR